MLVTIILPEIKPFSVFARDAYPLFNREPIADFKSPVGHLFNREASLFDGMSELTQTSYQGEYQPILQSIFGANENDIIGADKLIDALGNEWIKNDPHLTTLKTLLSCQNCKAAALSCVVASDIEPIGSCFVLQCRDKLNQESGKKCQPWYVCVACKKPVKLQNKGRHFASAKHHRAIDFPRSSDDSADNKLCEKYSNTSTLAAVELGSLSTGTSNTTTTTDTNIAGAMI